MGSLKKPPPPVNNDSDSSDVSMTDDSDEEGSLNQISDDEDNQENGADPDDEQEEEEEEDEVIKAIRQENQRQRDHPPDIILEDFVADLSFHPGQDILGVASVSGDVILYKYTNEENVILRALELHTKACRDVEFSEDGKVLYSVGKDKAIMLSDVESGKLIQFYENAHDAPVYCLTELNQNLFATGDDDGRLKLWDKRLQPSESQIYTIKKNEDYISDIKTNEALKYLLFSSGDGSLTTVDLQNRKFLMQSEEVSEELTCLGLFRQETKLAAGSSKGNLLLYNWNEFGLHSDLFPGTKLAINSMVPITENIVVTACEDGVLRATHLLPNRQLGKVGQHSLSADNLDIDRNGKFICSSSMDSDIKFWNIQYFEDFEKIGHKHKKHNKKKEMEYNLPSSKSRNVSDFFSGLC